MKLRPVRLEPVLDRRPWGVRSLAPLYPEKSRLAEPVGEAWLTGVKCRFADGPFAGRALGDVFHEMRPEWTGTHIEPGRGFPILAKFLFPGEKPSVQVHPGDDYAARFERDAGGRGKTEMWYVLLAKPGAEVLVGLKPGTTPESFRRAIAGGTAEECLNRLPVAAGDAVFIPPGTTHTIGGGLILCEIQEYSDITYRVFDYNRRDAAGNPRTLHIEKAMDVIRFGEDGSAAGKMRPVEFRRGPVIETHFLICRHFAAEKWEFAGPIAAESSPEHFDLLINLEGAGHFETASERIPYASAQAWLVPAALGPYRVVPEGRNVMLRTYLPPSVEECARALIEKGARPEDVSHVVNK